MSSMSRREVSCSLPNTVVLYAQRLSLLDAIGARLEAATARLEALAGGASPAGATAAAPAAAGNSGTTFPSFFFVHHANGGSI